MPHSLWLENLLGDRTTYKVASYSLRFDVSITLEAVKFAVLFIGQNSSVLQLPCEVHMRSFDTVTKHPIPQINLRHCVTLKDDKVRTFYTTWTTPLSYLAKKKSVNGCMHLQMPTV